jgi:hypothetical protein
MMGPERRDPFPRPAIPASGQEAIAVERARQDVIRANAGEYPNGRDQILRCLGAILPTTSSWDAYLGMDATLPVNKEDDFTRLRIHIDDDFVDQGAEQAFLEPHIGMGPLVARKNLRRE